MNLVLFDLDNTLLAGDSDYEWGQFLIAKGAVDGAYYEARNKAFYEDYKAGRLDIHAFLAFALRPLATHPREQLDAWHAEYMATRIRPMITPAARELVKQRLAEADLVAVITATNSFVTGPIAKEFGIPHLIATDPEEIDGRFTGKVAGTPCFREGKVTRLEHFLAAHGTRLDQLGNSWFYSDSHNDLPLLEQVQHPIAVDPDPTLHAHALARGWPVISLRDATPHGHDYPHGHEYRQTHTQS
jgi:HAD superfamily hydrolase (TIGR01490 family)